MASIFTEANWAARFCGSYVITGGRFVVEKMDDIGVFLGSVLNKANYAVFYLRGGHAAPVRKSLATVADKLGPSFLLNDRGCIFSR